MPRLLAINISPRRPHLARLVFSPQLSLSLSTSQLIKLKLKSGQQISPAQFQRLVDHSFTFQLKNRALRLVALSAQTSLLVEQKLKSHLRKLIFRLKLSPQDPDKVILNAISYLQERQLLNPADFVSSFLRKHASKSATHLRFLLQKKGVDSRFIPQSLSHPDDEVQKIKTIIQKKAKNKQRKQIISYLYRQGFSYPHIKKAIDESQIFS